MKSIVNKIHRKLGDIIYEIRKRRLTDTRRGTTGVQYYSTVMEAYAILSWLSVKGPSATCCGAREMVPWDRPDTPTRGDMGDGMWCTSNALSGCLVEGSLDPINTGRSTGTAGQYFETFYIYY